MVEMELYKCIITTLGKGIYIYIKKILKDLALSHVKELIISNGPFPQNNFYAINHCEYIFWKKSFISTCFKSCYLLFYDVFFLPLFWKFQYFFSYFLRKTAFLTLMKDTYFSILKFDEIKLPQLRGLFRKLYIMHTSSLYQYHYCINILFIKYISWFQD